MCLFLVCRTLDQMMSRVLMVWSQTISQEDGDEARRFMGLCGANKWEWIPTKRCKRLLVRGNRGWGDGKFLVRNRVSKDCWRGCSGGGDCQQWEDWAGCQRILSNQRGAYGEREVSTTISRRRRVECCGLMGPDKAFNIPAPWLHIEFTRFGRGSEKAII